MIRFRDFACGLALIALFACASVKAKNGSESVAVFNKGDKTAKNCTLIGDIQGDQNPMAFALDKTLEK